MIHSSFPDIRNITMSILANTGLSSNPAKQRALKGRPRFSGEGVFSSTTGRPKRIFTPLQDPVDPSCGSAARQDADCGRLEGLDTDFSFGAYRYLPAGINHALAANAVREPCAAGQAGDFISFALQRQYLVGGQSDKRLFFWGVRKAHNQSSFLVIDGFRRHHMSVCRDETASALPIFVGTLLNFPKLCPLIFQPIVYFHRCRLRLWCLFREAKMGKETKRYEQVAQHILHLIENGVLKEGDRVPSLRGLSAQMGVSVNTVKEAYWRLENRNHIVAVPQSGFYVRKQPILCNTPAAVDPAQLDPQEITLCQIFGAYQDAGQCTPEIQLAVAHIDKDFWPSETLGRYYQDAIRHDAETAFTYLISPGNRPLREQVARQGLSSGLDISPEDVVITNGCQEAIFLSLMAVCEPGDTVVLESPIYFSLLDLLRQLKLKIIEIPTADHEGLPLETLQFVLENHSVKAMFSIPNFNNPMGFSLPSWKKKKLVQLLDRYGVVLIEDDIYGDICFGPRPEPCKAYDKQGDVILCSSFSKTIAPGLRVGWMLPGKYKAEVNRLKTLVNLASTPINQMVVARFLKEGGYEQHLRRIRRRLQGQVEALRVAILNHFPAGTRVTQPDGGLFVWIELPEGFNTDVLYRLAVQSGILFAPGSLFSIRGRYRRHLRLSAGTWNDRVAAAISRLGRLCDKMKTRQPAKRPDRVAAG